MVCMCVYICGHEYMYVFVHVYMPCQVHFCMCVHSCVYACACFCVCARSCTCVCLPTHVTSCGGQRLNLGIFIYRCFVDAGLSQKPGSHQRTQLAGHWAQWSACIYPPATFMEAGDLNPSPYAVQQELFPLSHLHSHLLPLLEDILSFLCLQWDNEDIIILSISDFRM